MTCLFCAALLLFSPRAGADCDRPFALAELETVLLDAEEAAGRNGELFAAAAGYGRQALPCLAAVVSTEQAARIHRMVGLHSLVQGQRDQALWAFGASHRLQPDFAFSDEVFSASHPITKLYAEAANLPELVVFTAPQVGSGARFDGLESWERAGSTATLLQQVDSAGGVIASYYLWPEDPIPLIELERLLAEAPPVEPPPPEPVSALVEPVPAADLRMGRVRDPSALRPPLLAVAGASALAAGVSAIAAGAVAADYRNNEHSLAELDQLKARNNTLVYAAGGLGAVAVGAGVGVAFVWD
jgi:hypothetical protein